MEVVREFISKNKKYKAEIIKRTDGFFSIKILKWYDDEWFEGWTPITRGLSLMDTEEHAIEITLEVLRNLTGEDDEL